MKIHQLPMGARFLYEGQEYAKSGPMMGQGPGGTRLIPKWAVLMPVGEVLPVVDQKPELVSRSQVLQAWSAFCAVCETLVPEEQALALQAAREKFLKSIV